MTLECTWIDGIWATGRFFLRLAMQGHIVRSAAVPQLHEHDAVADVYAVDDGSPSLHLAIALDTRGVAITLALMGYLHRLRDDYACTGTLAVILGD